jgi:SAM-dependent methyltransferase
VVDTKLIRCRGCGGTIFNEIKSFGNFPYANIFPWPDETEPALHRLALIHCDTCGLVQLDTVPDPVELFSEYIWETSSSRFISAYLHDLAPRICKTLSRREKVVEVASNDGALLTVLSEYFAEVIGVEPASNLLNRRFGPKIQVYNDFFSESLCNSNSSVFRDVDLVVARNVIAHVPDIKSFLASCVRILADEGLLYLEFHDADALVKDLQFDAIYHEHQSYMSESALKNISTPLGLEIVDSWLGLVGGSSRSVLMRFNPSLSDSYEASARKSFASWLDFRERVDSYRSKLYDQFEALAKQGSKIVAFGASARSTTLLNFSGVGRYITDVVDSSERKHGRCWTGSRLAIKDPKTFEWNSVDVVAIFAWNFFDEIELQLRDLGFTGRLLRVLPLEPIFIEVQR